MHAEQFAWMILAGVAIFGGALLIRLLWMPQDDLAPSAAGASEPDATHATHARRIRTKKDAVDFFLHKTGDRELATLLAEAAETNGRDGYVHVRQGGNGRPYEVEYEHRSDEEIAADRRTFSEIRAEVDGLKAAFVLAATEDERDRLERQIAWMAGGICTLWINTPSSSDYQRLRHLVRETMAAFKAICDA